MRAPIVVKFLTRASRQSSPEVWLRQFPGKNPTWGNCRFVFDPDERQYDFLAVYDDLPKESKGKFAKGSEDLACAREHSILVTSEPSSIKQYGRRFVAQFGCVLTSQSESALPHPNAIRSQPALHWFYGYGYRKNVMIDFDKMVAHPPLEKTRVISAVASSKQQKHTLHARRFEFTGELKASIPELEVFGHGVRNMDDKSEALDAYRYHVAIENFVGLHHWTEKLADSFIGCTLPFYFGCPNAVDYFPQDSFIAIDIFNPDAAARTIRAAIDSDQYTKRLPAILEARRRVLYEYNLFAVLSRLIEERFDPARPMQKTRLLSRHALRAASPLSAAMDVIDKVRSRLRA